tara:strand:+ start:1081 stop:2145 length:1065 start_codon:yes stop_codon:yes gene_type:complete
MNKIINLLKLQESIPVDQFINLALYNKKFGYYMKKNPFGKKGDFITSPLISKLFGEMIAIWCVALWNDLGKPKKIVIAELGPGNATLCQDLLNTFKNFKDFYNCLEIKLIEKSNKLKKIQKIKIKNKKVKWVNKISNLNYGPIIFLGNEFFDSLPIKQIHRDKNIFLEKYVSLSKNKKHINFLFKKVKKNLINEIKKLDLINEDRIIEYPVLGIKYLKIISQKIRKYNGSLLIFDYGYTEKMSKNTLQSVKNHKYLDVFSNPGEADITHHINYKLFSKILKKNKLAVENVITQSEFLQKLGIVERANILSRKLNFKKKADIYYRLKRLLDYKEMGQLFKVLMAKKKGSKFSLGF